MAFRDPWSVGRGTWLYILQPKLFCVYTMQCLNSTGWTFRARVTVTDGCCIMFQIFQFYKVHSPQLCQIDSIVTITITTIIIITRPRFFLGWSWDPQRSSVCNETTSRKTSHSRSKHLEMTKSSHEMRITITYRSSTSSSSSPSSLICVFFCYFHVVLKSCVSPFCIAKVVLK